MAEGGQGEKIWSGIKQLHQKVSACEKPCIFVVLNNKTVLIPSLTAVFNSLQHIQISFYQSGNTATHLHHVTFYFSLEAHYLIFTDHINFGPIIPWLLFWVIINCVVLP